MGVTSIRLSDDIEVPLEELAIVASAALVVPKEPQ